MALFLSQNMSPSPDARCVPNIVKPLVLCSNTITQKGSLYMQLYDPQATRASRDREGEEDKTPTPTEPHSSTHQNMFLRMHEYTHKHQHFHMK